MTKSRSAPARALATVPWVGFLFLVVGATLAHVSTPQTSDWLPILRVIVFLPLGLGLLIVLTVRTYNDARRALWILLLSSVVLGVLFLVGSQVSGVVGSSSYAAGSGRASLSLSSHSRGSRLFE